MGCNLRGAFTQRVKSLLLPLLRNDFCLAVCNWILSCLARDINSVDIHHKSLSLCDVTKNSITYEPAKCKCWCVHNLKIIFGWTSCHSTIMFMRKTVREGIFYTLFVFGTQLNKLELCKQIDVVMRPESCVDRQLSVGLTGSRAVVDGKLSTSIQPVVRRARRRSGRRWTHSGRPVVNIPCWI